MSAALAFTPAAEASTNLKLEIRRVLASTPESLFNAWTQPESIARWFAPGDMNVRHASIDLRVGGAFRFEMQGATPDHPSPDHITAAAGVYTRIVPNKLLAFTWGGDCSPDEETLVTVAFHPVSGGTELVLTHERFTTEASLQRHEHGWMACLDKLQQVYSN